MNGNNNNSCISRTKRCGTKQRNSNKLKGGVLNRNLWKDFVKTQNAQICPWHCHQFASSLGVARDLDSKNGPSNQNWLSNRWFFELICCTTPLLVFVCNKRNDKQNIYLSVFNSAFPSESPRWFQVPVKMKLENFVPSGTLRSHHRLHLPLQLARREK